MKNLTIILQLAFKRLTTGFSLLGKMFFIGCGALARINWPAAAIMKEDL
jgi:hypothetical protein